ncbi:hypothetical protein BURCENBC7_AP2202 [Burkholderia cenocepacia BC7]|nr:hypothetical protein BURCENK562V_C4152 [Burkholderia cenocepacia K56-2Valvano]ERI25406.1 hypothetical protein BURCENBC7_AP2202 [Burkholderia cenocepacia BC7]
MHMHNSGRYTVGRWRARRARTGGATPNQTERRQRCGFWW